MVWLHVVGSVSVFGWSKCYLIVSLYLRICVCVRGCATYWPMASVPLCSIPLQPIGTLHQYLSNGLTHTQMHIHAQRPPPFLLMASGSFVGCAGICLDKIRALPPRPSMLHVLWPCCLIWDRTEAQCSLLILTSMSCFDCLLDNNQITLCIHYVSVVQIQIYFLCTSQLYYCIKFCLLNDSH